MLFYFTLPLMDHLIEMKITTNNAATGGITAQSYSSKMPLTNGLPTKTKRREVKKN